MSKHDASDPRRRDVHAVNDDGMLVCNPRDREAAHRADVDDIATSANIEGVTCSKCLAALRAGSR